MLREAYFNYFIVCLLSVFLFSASVPAQTNSCVARVLVTRTRNNIGIDGATATAVNRKTGIIYYSASKEDMPYFAKLPEGEYRVTIKKAGYKRSSRDFYLYCPLADDKVYGWSIELYRGNSKEIVKLNDSVPPQRKGKPPYTVPGGVLNGKAISVPITEYPTAARAAKASGNVIVKVLVDVDGYVVVASAGSGHPLLRAAAETAARAAKFSPTLLGGESVKVSGVITYYFVP